MNMKDIDDYLVPALVAVYGESGVEAAHKLEKFIGTKEYTLYSVRMTHDDYPMKDDLKRLLQAFAGPYGGAIVKAYSIQHGRDP